MGDLRKVVGVLLILLAVFGILVIGPLLIVAGGEFDYVLLGPILILIAGVYLVFGDRAKSSVSSGGMADWVKAGGDPETYSRLRKELREKEDRDELSPLDAAILRILPADPSPRESRKPRVSNWLWW